LSTGAFAIHLIVKPAKIVRFNFLGFLTIRCTFWRFFNDSARFFNRFLHYYYRGIISKKVKEKIGKNGFFLPQRSKSSQRFNKKQPQKDADFADSTELLVGLGVLGIGSGGCEHPPKPEPSTTGHFHEWPAKTLQASPTQFVHTQKV